MGACPERSPVTTPAHLEPTVTDRGFTHLPPIPGDYGGFTQVYESSAAERPKVWLWVVAATSQNGCPVHPAGCSIHLTAENAWKLADQLRHLVENHYQGDAHPEWAK